MPSEHPGYDASFTPGEVWLVGAGPGDPGLITLKGRDGIANADVVFYDALVNPVLLEHAQADAVLRYVGKKAGCHSFTQARINAMLAAEALSGRRVCRLKGGDPFVFGRGGEEAVYLTKRGIRVVIVPGVSAALAVPAAAGIPVTHRGCSRGVRIVTGHEVTGGEADADWTRTDTLVVLMGHRNIAHIVDRLLGAGYAGDVPAAVIAQGTLPTQRTVTAPLGSIARCVAASGLSTPALLVVGDVVRLGAEIALEHLPADLSAHRQ